MAFARLACESRTVTSTCIRARPGHTRPGRRVLPSRRCRSAIRNHLATGPHRLPALLRPTAGGRATRRPSSSRRGTPRRSSHHRARPAGPAAATPYPAVSQSGMRRGSAGSRAHRTPPRLADLAGAALFRRADPVQRAGDRRLRHLVDADGRPRPGQALGIEAASHQGMREAEQAPTRRRSIGAITALVMMAGGGFMLANSSAWDWPGRSSGLPCWRPSASRCLAAGRRPDESGAAPSASRNGSPRLLAQEVGGDVARGAGHGPGRCRPVDAGRVPDRRRPGAGGALGGGHDADRRRRRQPRGCCATAASWTPPARRN